MSRGGGKKKHRDIGYTLVFGNRKLPYSGNTQIHEAREYIF